MHQQSTYKEIFVCGQCKRQPIEPVVSQCGHIFCWKCLYRSVNEGHECSLCHTSIILKKCYPVFIQNEQQSNSNSNRESDASQHPVRPQAVYREKIINPGISNSSMPSSLSNLPNNINCGKQVAGVSYIPSMIANIFNQIDQPKPEEKDAKVYKKCKIITIILQIIFVVLILLLLFM